MLLPQRGAEPGVGMCCFRYASTSCSRGGHVVGRDGDLGDQPGLGVHVADEVVHPRERGVVLVDDDLHAIVEQGQVRVRDDARDLDDHVAFDIEPGHLEIDPHEHIAIDPSCHANYDSLVARRRGGCAAIGAPLVRTMTIAPSLRAVVAAAPRSGLHSSAR